MENMELPFEGKGYSVRFTLAQLCMAEGDLGVSILSPSADSLWSRPQTWQLAALLFAALRGSVAGLTLERCATEVCQPRSREVIDREIANGIKQIKPLLEEYYGVADKEAIDQRPLAESSGGASSGVSLA